MEQCGDVLTRRRRLVNFLGCEGDGRGTKYRDSEMLRDYVK